MAQHILATISHQSGVKIISQGLTERMDTLYKDTPTSLVLKMISADKYWTWAKKREYILVYKDFLKTADKAEIEKSFENLDESIRSKLQKPVALVFSKANPTQVLSQLSSQTGVQIVYQGEIIKIDSLYNQVPGDIVLELLAKANKWRMTREGDVIVIRFIEEKQEAE